MSFISMNVPTLPASTGNMKDFLRFVYTHEPLLKKYGAIKIVPPTKFQEVLKKTRTRLIIPSTIQQVTQLNQDDFIYSVNVVSCTDEKQPKQSLPINEAAFWQSLSRSHNQQQISSVSFTPEHSFFLKRVQQTKFNIHQLPRRSLLRYCDSNLLRQFVPSLVRTYGPGAIFPLASARQRLFSFNYHHEGGLRYWYIVPANERKALEDVFQQQTTSICLEHGCILIDPLMLDKYKIRYHRLTQRPNEIVVLAAGALSQSFTEDATWSETIDFALPSWLDDGHANAQTSCACRSNTTSLPEIIDTDLFNHALIQRYISTYLNSILDNKSVSNTDEHNLEMNEISISSNISLKSVDQLSNQITESFISNSLFETEEMDDNKHQESLKMPVENMLLKAPSESAYLTTPDQRQISFKSINDPHQVSSSQDFHEETMATSRDEPHCLSFEEILDIIVTPPHTVKSTESQTEEQIDDQSKILNRPSLYHKRTQIKNTRNWTTPKNRPVKKVKNNNKTLLISGMNHEVTKTDIQRYFVGCIKVTIKQSYLPPYLNYAFVLHRTNFQAEYNRKKSLNHLLFGSACHVEYAKKNFHRSREHQRSDIWNIIVRKIPENVTEECLRNLFIGCHSMKYIPARVVNKTKTKVTSSTKNKVLWG